MLPGGVVTGKTVADLIAAFLEANNMAVAEAIATKGQRVVERRSKWQRAQDVWPELVKVCGSPTAAYEAISAACDGRTM